jgi:hypothetical protein
MKKYFYLIVFMLGFLNSSYADGMKVGVSLTAGVFEASAKEKESDETSISKSGEILAAFPSIFVEKVLPNEKISLGLDWVPTGIESESTNHKQADKTSSATASTVDNNVQVDFENLLTLYVKANVNNNVYLKAGLSQVEMVTNEKLGTGSNYGDTTLDGYILGLGYEAEMGNDMFVRAEANWMEFGGASLTSTTNSDNTVSTSDIDGYGARISIGKSF